MASTAVETDPVTRPSTSVAWIVAAAQFAYVGWFGVCVWVALARAAHFDIPYQGDPYTATVDIFTGWSRGFRAPMMLTSVLYPAFTLASIGATAVLSVHERVRHRRLLFSLLVIGAVLVLGTAVLATLPAGRSVTGWILD